jgi:Ni,Fe-hydrogenase I cytochrome b subunit
MGSETTSPYWYTIGNWSYMMFVIQHPYEANSVHGADDPQWTMIAPTNPDGKF